MTKKSLSHFYYFAEVNLSNIKQKDILKITKRSGNAHLIIYACKSFTKRAAIFSKSYRTGSEQYPARND